MVIREAFDVGVAVAGGADVLDLRALSELDRATRLELVRAWVERKRLKVVMLPQSAVAGSVLRMFCFHVTLLETFAAGELWEIA